MFRSIRLGIENEMDMPFFLTMWAVLLRKLRIAILNVITKNVRRYSFAEHDYRHHSTGIRRLKSLLSFKVVQVN